ncbi:hypothetical protein HYE07_03810 [Mycoplasmopsis bovis]|nr:hypothetical protein [Mycoplasmopsis bovis]QQH27424.1 hypothetical protein HYE07_03810 [Mycoplasmopsis bovis]
MWWNQRREEARSWQTKVSWNLKPITGNDLKSTSSCKSKSYKEKIETAIKELLLQKFQTPKRQGIKLKADLTKK